MDERRASGRAGLLAIPVREHCAFLREPVNVGRLVAHHATVIATRVVPPDVVTPENEDVGLLALARRSFFGGWVRCLRERRHEYRSREHGGKDLGN